MVALLILTAGELLEARTTLASRSALSAHKSHCNRKNDGSESISPTGTSRPVSMSTMTSRTQGGGVMGLRSLSPKPHIRARCGCWTTSNEYRYGPLSELELIFFSLGVLLVALTLTLPRGAGGAKGCCWCITCGGPVIYGGGCGGLAGLAACELWDSVTAGAIEEELIVGPRGGSWFWLGVGM